MTTSPLAFVFPGQGSQSLGMLGELAEREPLVRDAFAEASEGAGVDLWSIAQDGPEEMLNRTEFTQPALLAAGVACGVHGRSSMVRGPRCSQATAWANTRRSSRRKPCRLATPPGWCADADN